MRVAIVGTGYIAGFHAEMLKGIRGVELVAVADTNLGKAKSFGERWGVPDAVGNIEDLAGFDIDIAHVLVPPTLHVPVTRALLEQGIGVFVEKPLCLSSADGHALERLAAARGLALGVNHNNVFHPAFQRILKDVAAGRIGTVEHVQVTLQVPLRQLDVGDYSHWMFRSPRNIIFEQAPHPFSQAQVLTGRLQRCHTTIMGSRELQPGQVFHDRWLIGIEGEHATAEFYFAFGQSFTRSEIKVFGTDGALEADLNHNLFCREGKTVYLDFYDSFLAGLQRGSGLIGSASRALNGYLLNTLGFGAQSAQFFVGMRHSIEGFYKGLESDKLPIDGERGTQIVEWCEQVTRDVADTSVPDYEFPPPGSARDGEIVVLGGTGFIGRRVIGRLLQRGAPVTCLVRRSHGLPPEITAAADRGQLRLFRASLEDADALESALTGARCVLQLATGGGATLAEMRASMVEGTLAMARAAERANVERFVFASSSAALYLGADAGARIDDSVGPDPEPEKRALYARCKAETEAALMRMHEASGFPVCIVRPAVVLGPGSAMQHSGLGLWARDNHCVGWGPGNTQLPVVYVDDVADAFVEAALSGDESLHGRALNLAADVPLTARRIVAELKASTGRALHFHPRALWLSQLMELGKWVVKKIGRRPDVAFPYYRDLKSRALVPKLTCETARELLGWRPIEDPERFLDLAVRVHGASPKDKSETATQPPTPPHHEEQERLAS